MNLISFNPEETQVSAEDSEILSFFKKTKEKKNDIQQGMSPKAIAEIISDHLISIVRKDLQEKVPTKKEQQ
jgi:hypothetical protein